MSDHGFHVHGPHDHAVEHAAHSGDSFAARIAVATAILSTVGALFGFEGGATQNEAMLLKNSAAIKKTEASNQWNYYQAKSNKQNLAELAVALNEGEKKTRYEQEVERYKGEKAEIKQKAEALEHETEKFEEESAHYMHVHHRWALATTLINVAIALSAIALLTRKRWLIGGIGIASGAGLVMGVLGILQI